MMGTRNTQRGEHLGSRPRSDAGVVAPPDGSKEVPAHDAVCRSILAVAPDIPAAELQPAADLHDDLGLDSIDLVNIAHAIEEQTGIEIPATDYARLNRLGQLVDFVAARFDAMR